MIYDISMLVACEVCGVEVHRFAATLKKHVFCSKECVGRSKRNGSSVFCAWCDSEFYRRFGEQDLGVRKNQFCSRGCYSEWRADKRTSYPKDGHRHKHRVVAESVLMRRLLPGEVVHHRDRNRQNCHPSNLCVFPSQSEHARCHFGKMSSQEEASFSLAAIAQRECRDKSTSEIALNPRWGMCRR